MQSAFLIHPEYIAKNKLIPQNIRKRVTGKHKPSSSTPQVDISIAPHTGRIVIGVDPAYHGKGYGSKLLQEFEVVSKEIGFNKLMLTVKSENAQAIKSYQRNGWVILSDDGKSVTMNKDI